MNNFYNRAPNDGFFDPIFDGDGSNGGGGNPLGDPPILDGGIKPDDTSGTGDIKNPILPVVIKKPNYLLWLIVAGVVPFSKVRICSTYCR